MNLVRKLRAFTLVEVAVAVGIVLLLLAVSTPYWLRYRGRTAVNRAVEVSRAVFDRAVEEAKNAGQPLSEALTDGGLETAAATTSTSGATVFIQIRKRTRAGDAAKLLTRRELPGSGSIQTGFANLGLMDLDGSSENGVFVEYLQLEGETYTTLATVPVDINGEFVLGGTAGNAAVAFRAGDYQRRLDLTRRGAVSPDRN